MLTLIQMLLDMIIISHCNAMIGSQHHAPKQCDDDQNHTHMKIGFTESEKDSTINLIGFPMLESIVVTQYKQHSRQSNSLSNSKISRGQKKMTVILKHMTFGFLHSHIVAWQRQQNAGVSVTCAAVAHGSEVSSIHWYVSTKPCKSTKD